MNFFEIDEFGRVNLFGYKIYKDDLMIILLLMFFYCENVDNTYLYIILILILIS